MKPAGVIVPVRLIQRYLRSILLNLTLMVASQATSQIYLLASFILNDDIFSPYFLMKPRTQSGFVLL